MPARHFRGSLSLLGGVALAVGCSGRTESTGSHGTAGRGGSNHATDRGDPVVDPTGPASVGGRNGGPVGVGGSISSAGMFSGDAGSGVTVGGTGVTVGGTGFTVGGTGFTDGGTGFTVGGTGFTDGGTGLVGVGGVGGLGGIGNSNGCPPGQFKLANGVCGCPVFAPNYCAAMGKCVNFTKAPETCGSCEHACGSTQACVDSACTPELVQLTELADCGSVLLVYANATLYALSTGVGELSSVPVAGGAPSMIATGLSEAVAFAVDGTSAYVANGRKVTKVTLSDGAKADVATDVAPIYDVAVQGASLYYAVDKPAADTSAAHADFGGFIKKVPIDGGTAEVVAGGMDLGQPQGVAVSGTNVLYATESAKNVEVQKGLPVGANAYQDPLHYKLGASQGSLLLGHRSVQTDGGYVYWSNDAVQRSKFGDSAPFQEQATSSLGVTTAFALGGQKVYFGSDLGDLGKGTILADEVIPMARNLGRITSMVVEPGGVYVASECRILKAPL